MFKKTGEKMKFKTPIMENLEFFYDSKAKLMIDIYVSVLLKIGFPPPRPVKLKFSEKLLDSQYYEDFLTEAVEGKIPCCSRFLHGRIKPILKQVLQVLKAWQSETNKTNNLWQRIYLLLCKLLILIRYESIYLIFVSIGFIAPLSLVFLSKSLGFTDIKYQDSLSFHATRSDFMSRFVDLSWVFIYWTVFTFYVFYSTFFVLPSLFGSISFSINMISINFWLYLLQSLMYLILSLIPAILVTKILFIFYEKLFLETSCIQTIFYILFDLSREDILISSDRKKLLLCRVEHLSRLTLLIPQSYKIRSKFHQQWLENHFQSLSNYLQERVRWIAAPTENTLCQLRDEFYQIAHLYITGEYGLFDWDSNIILEKSAKSGWQQNLVSVLIRLMGIVIPLGLMGTYIFVPTEIREKLFPGITIETNNVAYIFTAWLLITIDITLKLGVVESIIEVAKGLRDLSK